MSNQSRRNRAPLAPVPDPVPDGADPDGDPVTLDKPAQPEPAPDQAQPEPAAAVELPEPEPIPVPVYTASLSTQELLALTRLNEAVDFLADDIRSREESIARQQTELTHLRAAHESTQRQLLALIQQAIASYGLAGGIMYRADLKTGQLVPHGPVQSG